MIYPKPRQVDPERAKRYIARSTPDEIVTYIDWFELQKHFDHYNLDRVSEVVAMKMLFSILMEDWLKRMKIKHKDPYMRTSIVTEFDISYNRYIIRARYQ